MTARVQLKVGKMVLMDRTLTGSAFAIEEKANRLKSSVLGEYRGYWTGARFGPPSRLPANYVETPEASAFAKKAKLEYEIIKE
jgi:hypothetical protein